MPFTFAHDTHGVSDTTTATPTQTSQPPGSSSPTQDFAIDPSSPNPPTTTTITTAPKVVTSPNLPICSECGTQYRLPTPSPTNSNSDSTAEPIRCQICEDPRQYVPASGQAFTTLAKLTSTGHRNVWTQTDRLNPKVWSIKTEPAFAIGQRALFIQTAAGNVLWDMITLLDQETVDRIHALGGLSAILISHPHYYTTISDWAATFPDTPVYVGAPDEVWISRVLGSTAPLPPNLHFLTEQHTPLPGLADDMTAVLSGGHFAGSLCLYWSSHRALFIADTVLTSPSATNPVPGLPGVISYTWWYSVPNRIPLPPRDIWAVWESIADLDWNVTYGAFIGMDVRETAEELARGTGGVKGRMRESMRIFVRAMGWTEELGGEKEKGEGDGQCEAVNRILGE